MKPLSTGKFLSASSHFTTLVLAGLDVAGVLIIFNVSHWLVTGDLAPNLLLNWKLVLIVVISVLCNYLMDLYAFESSLSQLGILERSFIAILMTGATVAIAVYVIGPSFIGGFVGRGVLAISLAMLWLWSLSLRYFLDGWFRRRRSQVAWAVLTHGDVGRFVEHFRSLYPVETLLLLGPPGEAALRFDDERIESAGTWDGLETLMNSRHIAGIIVAAPNRMPEELVDRLMTIRISGVRIYTLSDFYEKYLARLPVFHLNQQWIATAHGFQLIHNPIGLRFKRYIDVVMALAVGLFLLPVLAALAFTVFLTSGTPVLYRQSRVGENGRPFTVYKFRSMIVDAEPGDPRYTSHDDPRTTPLGKVLRRFHLDELPQLWNVLRGDMSFVGPRPERPEFIVQLQAEVPYYNLRHVVRPGITGWAQVMYGYGEGTGDAVEKLQYDLFYIKNYSLLLDISILVRSVKVILFGVGR